MLYYSLLSILLPLLVLKKVFILYKMFCFCLMTLAVLTNCAESLNLNVGKGVVQKGVVQKGVVHKLLNGKEYDEESMEDDYDYDDESDVLEDEKTNKDSVRKINNAQKDVVYLDKTSNKEYILKGLTRDDESTEKILLKKFQVTTTLSEKSIESRIDDDDYTEKRFSSDDNTIGAVENEMSIDKASLQLTSENATTLSELLITSEASSDFPSQMTHSSRASSSEQQSDLMTFTETLSTDNPLQSEKSVTIFSSEQSSNFMASMESLATSPAEIPSSQAKPSLIISVISDEQQTELSPSQSMVSFAVTDNIFSSVQQTISTSVFPVSSENPTLMTVTSESMTKSSEQQTIAVVSSETQPTSTIELSTLQSVTSVSLPSSEQSISSMSSTDTLPTTFSDLQSKASPISSVPTSSSLESSMTSSIIPETSLSSEQLMTSTKQLETSTIVAVNPTSPIESIVMSEATLASDQTTNGMTPLETKFTSAFTQTLKPLTTSLASSLSDLSISSMTLTETLPVTQSQSIESSQALETTSLPEQTTSIETPVMSTTTKTLARESYSLSEQTTDSMTSIETQTTEQPTSVSSSFEQPTDPMTSSELDTTLSSDLKIATEELVEFPEEETTLENYDFNNLTEQEDNDDMSTDETTYQLTSVENATILTELLIDKTVNSLSTTDSSQFSTKSIELSIISKLPINSMTSTDTLPLSLSSEKSISSLSTLTTTLSIVPSIISVTSFSSEIPINKTTSLEIPVIFPSTVLSQQVNSQESSTVSISTKVPLADKQNSFESRTTTITPKFKQQLSQSTNFLSTLFNVSSSTPQTSTEFAPVCNFSQPNYDAGDCRLPCKVKGSQIKITAGCCCLL